jgi:hypothetical protein
MPQSRKSVPIEEIVDFDGELKTFQRMVAGEDEKRLMFIRAPGGRGKTCILRQMRQHCRDEDIPFCWIDFRWETYDAPHLTLAREMCEQLSISPCQLAKALLPLSAYGAKGEAKAEMGDVTDSQVITQVLTQIAPTDEALRQDYVKQRLKRAFANDLLTAKRLLVCFLDSFEDVRDEESWLLDVLFHPVRERELKNVIVVTAGHRWPKIEDWEWEGCAHLLDTLSTMTVDHVKEYAGRIGYAISDEVAHLCWRACREGRIPLHMGIFVKNLKAVEVRP